MAKPIKPSNAPADKEKLRGGDNLSFSYADPDKFVEEILEKTTSIILSEVGKILHSEFGIPGRCD